jgi:hypothetical protein
MRDGGARLQADYSTIQGRGLYPNRRKNQGKLMKIQQDELLAKLLKAIVSAGNVSSEDEIFHDSSAV